MDHSNVDLSKRAQSQTSDDVTVTVAVPSRDETQLLFGASLYEVGIQPSWISVDNRSARPCILLKAGIDPQYYSPLESSYQQRSRSKPKQAESYRFFHSKGFMNPVLAGTVGSGFVFTQLDEGAKAVN